MPEYQELADLLVEAVPELRPAYEEMRENWTGLIASDALSRRVVGNSPFPLIRTARRWFARCSSVSQEGRCSQLRRISADRSSADEIDQIAAHWESCCRSRASTMRSGRMSAQPLRSCWTAIPALVATLALTIGCVPAQYSTGFPPGLEAVSVSSWFANDQRILVIPCWRTTGATDTYEFGPPTVISTAEISWVGL